MSNITMNRKYKDGLFRMIFSEKKELLSLYNAISGTSYTDVEELQVNTLKGIIFLSIENDVSFIIGGELMLYEHQSTTCGNMPLRSLLYIADLYAGITEDKPLHKSKMIELQRPRFVVFYNGSTKLPDRSTQKLSDAYPKLEATTIDPEELELIVTVLNINKGHNKELMEHCKKLSDYAFYVDAVRTYAKEMPIEEAVEKVIDECIAKGILVDLLRKRRAEVTHMSIYEYDAVQHIAQEKEDSWSDGEKIGKEIGKEIERVELIRKKVKKSKSLETIADELECESDEIRALYETVLECGVEASVEEILEKAARLEEN